MTTVEYFSGMPLDDLVLGVGFSASGELVRGELPSLPAVSSLLNEPSSRCQYAYLYFVGGPSLPYSFPVYKGNWVAKFVLLVRHTDWRTFIFFPSFSGTVDVSSRTATGVVPLFSSGLNSNGFREMTIPSGLSILNVTGAVYRGFILGVYE